MAQEGVHAYVHIIESPGDIDLLDGRTEGKCLNELFKLSGIPCSYNMVTTDNALEAVLSQRITEESKKHEMFPVLHISAHASKDGIQLTDGTNIQWEHLGELLSPI